MKNIVLTGFMGTGKTEVGRLLAQRLGFTFLDADSIIEQEQKMTITEIFQRFGEPFFRDIETAVLKRLSEKEGVIISTGGGAVLRQENMDNLRKKGIIICLTASPETILRRTSNDTSRPLLQVKDPLNRIRELLEFRRPYYEKADIMVETEGKSPIDVAEEIIYRIGELQKSRAVGQQSRRKRRKRQDYCRVRVELGERSYDIVIGKGVLPKMGELIEGFGFNQKIAVISNPTVFGLYGNILLDSLKNSNFDCFEIIIPDGEEYKDYLWSYYILTELLKHKLDRRSCLIALGGGVIGDITGFVASTYMRGINLVQVPTTLLAHVDSSVGGKTGVNHYLGKNMIGTFYQPRLVGIDTETLRTLPEREFRSGLAEVVKYGVIWDKNLFEFLLRGHEPVLNLEPQSLTQVIKRCCQIKAEVVSMDERESGLRALLNFGHTIGHAIETITGYRRYLHGEAVSIGMRVEARLSSILGICDGGVERDMVNLLTSFGLPVDIPAEVRDEDLIKAMEIDKKTLSGRLRFVLPEDIGKVRIEEVRDMNKIKEAIGACRDYRKGD